MGISKITSEILFSHNIERNLSEIIKKYPKGKIFLVTEPNVKNYCSETLAKIMALGDIKEILIPSGESSKKLSTVEIIWDFLSKNRADRKSLLINFGGGMLTDLAGFAATTFKRGIDFVNIPTTLLAQVDASVGGKTGINFNGLKNEIGTFREPNAVIINSDLLKTIDQQNFISGYAEMIKHGLIYGLEHLSELKEFNIESINYDLLQEIIRHSVDVKKYFVENDPTEQNIRKALNFGHTTGHAFESMAMEKGTPILHGFAVAYGMIVELYLSYKICSFSKTNLVEISEWLLKLYGKFEINDSDFTQLLEFMTHDKKNEDGIINFTLISEIGKFEINQTSSKDLIIEALQFYKQL